MRRSKTSLLKLPNLRAKEDVREKTGECFQDLEERRWKKTTNVPRNQHKIWQAFHLFSFSFTWSLALRHYHPPLSSCAVQKTKHLRRGWSSPFFLPPPPPPLSAPDTQAKSTKHDMKPHPNNSLPTFKAECRT